MKNKYVIGTHVMWFEIEMFEDFINGMINLLEPVKTKDNITIDLCFNLSEKVENIDTKQIDKNQLLAKFNNNVNRLKKVHPNVVWKVHDNDEFYFDNDILNDKVHLFFKDNRNSLDEYSMSGHKFLHSFELAIHSLGIEHDTMLKKIGNIIFLLLQSL